MNNTTALQVKRLLEADNRERETLRSQSVLIPSDYEGTIDPELLNTPCTETPIRISGNSSGPFVPESYFSHSPQERMLVILKEPYITVDSFAEGDRGGHDQAEEYRKSIIENGWDGIGNSTYQNIAKIAYSVLTGDIFDGSDEAKAEAVRLMLGQVAVINVNCFPCICGTETTDGLISRWAERNYSTMTRQIELYDAQYIYCGGVGYDCFHAFSSAEGQFGPYCLRVLPHSQIREIAGDNVYGQRDFYYDDGHFVINGYHPSRFCYADLEKLLLIINHWRNNLVSLS